MADFSKLKTGPQNMTSGRRGGFIPTIYWKQKDETHYLAFLTALDEVPKLLTHFIQTTGGWRYFICRKNEIFEDESNGECPICEMKSLGKNAQPVYRHLALAVELEPKYEQKNGRKVVSGYEVLMDEWTDKEGNDKTTPHVGVVSESAKNFWTPFAAHVLRMVERGVNAELENTVYEVVRNGKGDQTSYSFYEDDNRPDLSELEVPTLEDFIEEKGALEYYEKELSGGVEEDDSETEETSSREKGTQETESDFDKLKAELESK